VNTRCNFKIERMSGFDGHPIAREDVSKELWDLQARGQLEGLQFFPDTEPAADGHWQFPRMSVGWESEGAGYVVQCYETVDSRSCILAESASLSEPEVYLELGGKTGELWPAQLFVPFELALSAIEHFLRVGRQDPDLAWVGLNVFPRKTVPRRPRRTTP